MAQTSTASTPTSTPAGGNRGATQTQWDNSWFDRLTAKHKAVFDSPDFAEGNILGPGQATRYINGVHDALGSSDVQTVIVVRHHAIAFAFNDAMWAKYEIGKDLKIAGDGEEWATKNPFSASRSRGGRGGAAPPAGNNDRPQGNAEWLSTHGHILLGCDLATQGYAGTIASRTKGTMKTIYEELKANLVPGMILQPNGVYAALRAQEAGCVFMRST
ncbi:MAG TPA: hypothetical protein VGM82_07395 [Gemmatimonadaceae bacterium]